MVTTTTTTREVTNTTIKAVGVMEVGILVGDSIEGVVKDVTLTITVVNAEDTEDNMNKADALDDMWLQNLEIS
jgi:hypothetical protein